MKVYTKTGDQGETSLLGGVRVKKHHVRIEAYGTTDELNALIGYCRACFEDNKASQTLASVQDRLFALGSYLASNPKSKMEIPHIKATDIEELENAIDEMEKGLPELKNFILPGGNRDASMIHLARCVCRRAERLVSHLNEVQPLEGVALQYLNRLSDYLFVLGRHYVYRHKLEELTWKPRG